MFAKHNLRHSNPLPRRLLALVMVGAFALGTVACSATPQKPPEAPLKQAIKNAPYEDEMVEPEIYHQAPPPAYGNKVVMAQQETNREHF